MTKKDEKEADRPHYYSQFWLDVAAGRKVIGASKAEDGADQAEADLQEPTPQARRGGRAGAGISPEDGYREARAPAAVADEAYDEEEEFPLAEDEGPDTVSEVSDEDIPTIVDTPEVLTPDIEPEPEPSEGEEPEEDEDFYDEEEEEEDEEEWPARGRKKPKPGRQAKVPKAPARKPKRGGRF